MGRSSSVVFALVLCVGACDCGSDARPHTADGGDAVRGDAALGDASQADAATTSDGSSASSPMSSVDAAAPPACRRIDAGVLDAGHPPQTEWDASMRGAAFVQNELGWAMTTDVGISDFAPVADGVILASFAGQGLQNVGGREIDGGDLGTGVLWKVDNAGNVVWVEPISAMSRAEPLSIAVGEDGWVLVAERRRQSPSDDCENGVDEFGVAAFTSAGERMWETSPVVQCRFEMPDVAADANGSVAFSVPFEGTATVGSTQYVADAGDGLVVMHDHDGSVRWSVLVTGEGWQTPWQLALFPDGDLLVAGTFVHEIEIGTFRTPARGFGTANLFVARLRGDDGTVQWVKWIDGAYTVDEVAAAMGEDGDFVVTGRYRGYLVLDDGDCLQEPGHDGFVLAFDGNADMRWAKTYSDSFLGPAYVAISPFDGRVALSLTFNDPIVLGDEVLYPRSGTDTWLWQVDERGAHLGATSFVGLDDDWPYGLSFGPDGALWLHGFTDTFSELPMGDVLGYRYLARFPDPDVLN